MFRRFNEKTFSEKAIRILTVLTLAIGIPIAIKSFFSDDTGTKTISTTGENSPIINGDGNTINNNTYNEYGGVDYPVERPTKTGGRSPSSNTLQVDNLVRERVVGEKLNIAILPFENLSPNAKDDWLSKGLAESLLEPISKIEKYIVLEAVLRNKVLEEIDFQQGKYVDITSAVRIGKMLGADNIVIGTFQIFDRSIKISTRIVDVEKGKLVKNSNSVFEGSIDAPFQMQKDFANHFYKTLNE